MSKDIEERVIKATHRFMVEQHYVSFIDVLIAMNWLKYVHFKDWTLGKASCLEDVIEITEAKLKLAREYFNSLMVSNGYSYVIPGMYQENAKRKLKASVNPKLDLGFKAHYIDSSLSQEQQRKLKEKLEKPPEIVVFRISKATSCSKCAQAIGEGYLLYQDGHQGLCMDCAGFGDFDFLPSGDAKLTIRATKYSSTYAVIVKFSKARGRYERQGILVSKDALKLAQDSMV